MFEFVALVTTQIQTSYLPSSLWIGLIRPSRNESFMWADNSPYSFFNWADGEPTDYYEVCKACVH